MDNSPVVEDTPPTTFEVALLSVIENENIDPERLEKFLELQFRYKAEQAKDAFNQAMAGFQGDCPVIRKTKHTKFESKNNNKVDYKYSPLDEIVYVAKPHLQKWGLSFSWNIKILDQNTHELVTTIRHADGHSETFSHFFNPLHDDNRMNQSQRVKSALTYAKRAGLESALGIVTTEDDDDAKRALDKVISTDQLNSIETLLGQTNTDRGQFLEYMKVDDFTQLSEYEAKKAIRALTQKRAVK